MRMAPRRYWIGVASGDDVAAAVAGGFVQVNHGKAGPLERMRAGDGFAYYSPRERNAGGAPLQQFTAIGRVRDAPLALADGADGEPVFRRAMDYLPAEPVAVKVLLDELSFVRSRTHWGAAFRFGFLGVPEADFERIARAMGRPFRADFPEGAPALQAELETS
jgi:hypothetical protein